MTTLQGPGQVRRGTAAEWTSDDPTLLPGEFGYETDTGLIKIGDGANTWSDLPYFGGPDRVFIDAGRMIGNIGGPLLTIEGSPDTAERRTWRMDGTSTESVAFSELIPATWRQFRIYYWWSNTTTTAGNVVWQCFWQQLEDGDDANVAANGAGSTVAAPTVAVQVVRSQIGGTLTCYGGAWFRGAAIRASSDVADTLNGVDVNLYGVELVRVL